jgi:sulfatase maturation enzyme AslB (radical SAM superfamily)
MYSIESLAEIHFELSSHCNSKCPQCPRYNNMGRVQKDLDLTHLDIEVIKNLPIAQMKNLKEVNFCGNFGDPLMHPRLNEIIETFPNQKIRISTNASLRSEQWWNDLAKHNNVAVIFCIDGIGKEHERYRRNTSYDKIMRNAKAFIDAGGEAHWQFIVFKHNEHQIDEAKTLSNGMGFKQIRFMYSDRFDTNDRWPVYENGVWLYDLEKPEKQVTLRQSLESRPGEKFWKSLLKNKADISCVWSEKRKLYIHSDGGVYPCCMIAGVQSGRKIEKLLYKKLVKDYTKINLHYETLRNILSSDVFVSAFPSSFAGDPFQHPVCIEYCNKKTGKIVFSDINEVI